MRLVHPLELNVSPLEPTTYQGVAMPWLGLAPVVQLFAQNTLEKPHDRMAHAEYEKMYFALSVNSTRRTRDTRATPICAPTLCCAPGA